MIRRPSAWLLSALLVSTLASSAMAHITLTDPKPRHPADDLKLGPCGVGENDSRTTDPNLITTYQAGETITVRWKESINHPSHFRISLAPSDAEFVDPTGYDDKDGGPNVLVDDIEDTGGPSGTLYEQQVTLPNEPCPTCVLQLIQVMTDKQPWNGDDIYYQCADLVIEGGVVSPTGGTGGVATSGGGSVGTGGTLATGGAFPTTGGTGGVTGGTGGTVGSGGALASGGAVATGGAVTGVPTGGQTFEDGGDDSDDSGGGCQASWTGVDPTGPSALLWLVLGGLTLGRFRRRWT
jgi:MYXO-CTERM domain-containing protein